MPVVGSNVTVDVHVTGETDLDTIHGATRRNDRLHPTLAETVQQAVERTTSQALQEKGIGEAAPDVEVALVDDRVAGAPRERITARLDVEGDSETLAAVDTGMSTPERARIADAVEEEVLEYLNRHDLADRPEVTVSVTPVQFR